jgi:hydrogenase expression/formation protein HypD
MRYVDEYRNEAEATRFVQALEGVVTRPWSLMEICGGQTHTLMKSGIDQMFPESVTMIHGPGCPVCVTPLELIDRALVIARRPEVIFTSFGDMLRVPGSTTDLLSVKSEGGDVRIVYSPLDAVKLAQQNPDREVVFFAVGFETTAPANAIFLAAGHVCTVMGYWEYDPIAEKYQIPITVTGFEPLDLLQGAYMTLKALEEGRWGVENQYTRSVSKEGNRPAQKLLGEVFEVCDRKWRGIGEIPGSGYRLRPELRQYDAELRFDVGEIVAQEAPECIAGEILKGQKKPHECSAYGTKCTPCTPEHPLGAPMVSSEGACAAYYLYARHE